MAGLAESLTDRPTSCGLGLRRRTAIGGTQVGSCARLDDTNLATSSRRWSTAERACAVSWYLTGSIVLVDLPQEFGYQSCLAGSRRPLKTEDRSPAPNQRKALPFCSIEEVLRRESQWKAIKAGVHADGIRQGQSALQERVCAEQVNSLYATIQERDLAECAGGSKKC